MWNDFKRNTASDWFVFYLIYTRSTEHYKHMVNIVALSQFYSSNF